MNENSLLVNRIGGRVEQVLAAEDALYVVPLGSQRHGLHWRRAISDPSEFRPGPGAVRLAREEVQEVRVRSGDAQTGILLRTRSGEEYSWHLDCSMTEEHAREIFCEIPLELEGFGLTPGKKTRGLTAGTSGPGALADVFITAMALLLPALWWLRQSRLLLCCNLLLLPLGLVLAARSARRLSAEKLLWLAPGLALGLANARLNLVDPRQLLLPSLLIAAALASAYAGLHTGRRRLRRTLAVLLACLLTYAPGAALSVNSMWAEPIRVAKVDSVTVSPGWVESFIDGETRRFYARPDVCETLSPSQWCELRLYRGALGIEYWAVMPENPTGSV